MSTYKISQQELIRREAAFARLSLSLLFTFTLSLILWGTNPVISIIIWLIILLILIVSRFLLKKMFRKYQSTIIKIEDGKLERISVGNKEVYQLENIKRLKIIKTTNKTIRSVDLVLTNNKRIVLNGLDNFSAFVNELSTLVDEKVTINYASEPIDYDHPLFYVVLGSILGLVPIPLLNSLVNLNSENQKNLALVFGLYVACLGGYFLIQRPLTNHYGGKSKLTDLVFGFLFAGAGLAMMAIAII